MSDWPSFLIKTRPDGAILDYSHTFSPSQVASLTLRCRHLHYSPCVIVCPGNCHIKDGHHLISEIQNRWELGANSCVIVISPSQQHAWAGSGSELTKSGITQEVADQILTARHLDQCAPQNLYQFLYAALRDVDQIALSTNAVTAASSYPPRLTAAHRSADSPLPIIFLLLFAFVIFAGWVKKTNSEYKTNYRRLNHENGNATSRDESLKRDTTHDAALDYDLDRILNLVHHQEGSPIISVKPKQVPMAEFAKRTRHYHSAFQADGLPGDQNEPGEPSQAVETTKEHATATTAKEALVGQEITTASIVGTPQMTTATASADAFVSADMASATSDLTKAMASPNMLATNGPTAQDLNIQNADPAPVRNLVTSDIMPETSAMNLPETGATDLQSSQTAPSPDSAFSVSKPVTPAAPQDSPRSLSSQFVVPTSVYQPGSLTNGLSFTSVENQAQPNPSAAVTDVRCPRCHEMTPKAFAFCLKCGGNVSSG